MLARCWQGWGLYGAVEFCHSNQCNRLKLRLALPGGNPQLNLLIAVIWFDGWQVRRARRCCRRIAERFDPRSGVNTACGSWGGALGTPVLQMRNQFHPSPRQAICILHEPHNHPAFLQAAAHRQGSTSMLLQILDRVPDKDTPARYARLTGAQRSA